MSRYMSIGVTASSLLKKLASKLNLFSENASGLKNHFEKASTTVHVVRVRDQSTPIVIAVSKEDYDGMIERQAFISRLIARASVAPDAVACVEYLLYASAFRADIKAHGLPTAVDRAKYQVLHGNWETQEAREKLYGKLEQLQSRLESLARVAADFEVRNNLPGDLPPKEE